MWGGVGLGADGHTRLEMATPSHRAELTAAVGGLLMVRLPVGMGSWCVGRALHTTSCLTARPPAGQPASPAATAPGGCTWSVLFNPMVPSPTCCPRPPWPSGMQACRPAAAPGTHTHTHTKTHPHAPPAPIPPTSFAGPPTCGTPPPPDCPLSCPRPDPTSPHPNHTLSHCRPADRRRLYLEYPASPPVPIELPAPRPLKPIPGQQQVEEGAAGSGAGAGGDGFRVTAGGTFSVEDYVLPYASGGLVGNWPWGAS